MPWPQFTKTKREVEEKGKEIRKEIKRKTKIIPKWVLILVSIFLALFLILAGLFSLYQYSYQNKVYKGISLGDLSLSGKTQVQVEALLQAKIDQLADQGVEFQFEDRQFTLNPIISVGSQIGLAYEVWSYDTKQIAMTLYSLGRSKNWLYNSFNQLYFLLVKPHITVDYQLNQEEFEGILKNEFSELESPGQNAKLNFSQGTPAVLEEKQGQVFDYLQAQKELEQSLRVIQSRPISLYLITDNPQVTKAQAEKFLDQVNSTLQISPLYLSFTVPEYYQGRKAFYQTQWIITQSNLKKWLEIKQFNLGSTNQDFYLGVNQEIVEEYLTDITEKIDTPAKDAKFEITDGKVSEWQSSQDGFVLNIEETIGSIENGLVVDQNNKVGLVLTPDKSKITNDNVNDLGIRELISTGESNFAGSPRNRRHNITNGANSLNGLLIKPDEEFSLLQALGKIDAQAGYKPELVIKEGKTIPEYGGGLCQIGTTMFRLSINTGLPVTQRRNHSYRVGYYEPAGTDATIYDPWPDFKFVNDTPNYLLLQTRIEGNNIIFEFWGTSDGRQVETTDPVVYNIKAPPPTKYIETDELKPGEKRLQEHAHNGADAHFTRTITWPQDTDKESIEEVWESHYVPWQEVYLIGITSTTTPEITQ